MKKLICMILVLCMAAALFCACEKANDPNSDTPEATDTAAMATEAVPEETENIPEETEAIPEETEPAPTEAPEDPARELIESLLPDWEPDSVSGRSYHYSGFGFSVLSEYIEECRGKGFGSLHDYDDNNTGWILYRDDIWIEITDNTHNEAYGYRCSCSLYFCPAAEDKSGMTADDVLAVTGDMGIGMDPVAAIDLSPEGLYAITGLQLYRVLYDMSPGGDPNTSSLKNDQYFLVGGGEALLYGRVCEPIENLPSGVYRHTLAGNYGELAYGDIDADGETEVVMLGLSGMSSMLLDPVYVCRAVDGKPKLVHSGYYELSSAQHGHIVTRGEKVYFITYDKKGSDAEGNATYVGYAEHELVFERGELKVADPEGETVFDYWGPLDL